MRSIAIQRWLTAILANAKNAHGKMCGTIVQIDTSITLNMIHGVFVPAARHPIKSRLNKLARPGLARLLTIKTN